MKPRGSIDWQERLITWFVIMAFIAIPTFMVLGIWKLVLLIKLVG